jgi:gliding motility-associated-like protein
LVLDATTPGATYLWSTGATTPTLSVGSTGTYWVEVQQGQCSASDTVQVTFLPTPQVDLGTDTTLCEGDVLVLDVTQQGAVYLWQDGSTAATLTVSQAGTYSVVVDLQGCTASASVQVAFVDVGALDLGADATLCPGESLPLDALVPGATYLWSDGSTGSTYLAGTPGIHWVEATVGGCTLRDSVTVAYVPLPLPELGGVLVLCEGDTVAVGVAPGAAEVLWNTGATTDSITVAEAGNYAVTLSLDGCSATATLTVEERAWVTELEPQVLGICDGDRLELDTPYPDAAHQWSTGATGPTLAVFQPGTYVVSLLGDCIDAEGLFTVVPGNCLPAVHVPNAFSPNGDGINDVFVPVVDGPVLDYAISIHDRWGRELWRSTAPGEGWDGRAGGQDLPQGVYVWRMQYRAVTDDGLASGTTMGHVTLLR